MAKCARCGRPGPGGVCPTCVGELRAAKTPQSSTPKEEAAFDGVYRSEPEPESDPTIVMDRASEPVAETRTQPRADFPQDNQPPRQPHESSHEQIPEQAVTKNRTSRMPLIAFLTVLLLGVIGVGVWWFVTQGGFDFAQQRDEQAAPADDESPDADESEASDEEDGEASEEDEAPSEESDDGPEAKADGDTPNLKQSIAGVGKFFEAAPGDPSSGWEFLSTERQQVEDWTGFVTHWNGMIGAKIEEDSCSMEDSVLVCDNEYTSKNGDVTVKKAEKIPVVYEEDMVKLDLAAGTPKVVEEDSAAEENPTVRENDTAQGNSAAEETNEPETVVPEQSVTMTELDLEALRADTLKGGSPVGSVVAVLSTKRDGITDETQWAANGTHTFYYADIVVLHHELAKRFPNERVYFLQSRDVDDKKSNDLYYTAVDRGFSSKDEAQAWCEGVFPHLEGKALKNECMPRNLR